MRQCEGAPLGVQLLSKYDKNDVPGALWKFPQAVSTLAQTISFVQKKLLKSALKYRVGVVVGKWLCKRGAR